jgi:NAD(P)-dependent dehydrogenase (short-subunit alcohol dehydrogenase family)
VTDSGPTYPAALSLDGRRAVVTGGTKGAGAAVVKRLRHAGAYVIAVARGRPGEGIDADEFVAADISTHKGPMPWPLTCGDLVACRSSSMSRADRVRPAEDSPA